MTPSRGVGMSAASAGERGPWAAACRSGRTPGALSPIATEIKWCGAGQGWLGPGVPVCVGRRGEGEAGRHLKHPHGKIKINKMDFLWNIHAPSNVFPLQGYVTGF